MNESVLIASTAKLNRQELAEVLTPPGTATHGPVAHVEVVEALVETLSFRDIGVVKEEYAVSKDGMKMFGVVANHKRVLRLMRADNLLAVRKQRYVLTTDSEHGYLAILMDAWSRRVVGWELGENLSAELTLAAVHRALADRAIEPGIVHHSDRGIQHCCHAYVEKLKAHGFAISMSRSGNPYDKAKAESFMKTLKSEEV
jgi:hypothetical protein